MITSAKILLGIISGLVAVSAIVYLFFVLPIGVIIEFIGTKSNIGKKVLWVIAFIPFFPLPALTYGAFKSTHKRFQLHSRIALCCMAASIVWSIYRWPTASTLVTQKAP